MDMADGSFEIMRGRPRVVAVIIMFFVLPAQILAAILQRDFFQALSNVDLTTLDPETGNFEGAEDLQALGGTSNFLQADLLLSYPTLPFIGVAFTWLILQWRVGNDPTVIECLSFTLRRSHKILAAFVMCKLIQLAGLVLLMVPMLVATVALIVVAPVIAAEDAGPVAAMRRSWELVRQRFWPCAGIVVLTAIVTSLLESGLGSLPSLLAFGFGSWASMVFLVARTLIRMLTTAFTVGVACLLYLDLSTRLEGRDIADRISGLERSAFQTFEFEAGDQVAPAAESGQS